MGHGWAQALVVLQMINILHQKRVWPHETIFFMHINILRMSRELLVTRVYVHVVTIHKGKFHNGTHDVCMTNYGFIRVKSLM